MNLKRKVNYKYEDINEDIEKCDMDKIEDIKNGEIREEVIKVNELNSEYKTKNERKEEYKIFEDVTKRKEGDKDEKSKNKKLILKLKILLI